MKIANIVTSNSLNVDDNINIVDSMDKIIEGLPTLVTSYKWVSENYEDYDIYDKKLGDKLYWTFAKTERRDIFYNDIEEFLTIANKDLISNIKYIFVDPIHFNLSKIKKIITKIYSLPNKISFKHMDMIYIYGDGLIFGIDLNLLNYIGINVERAENKIKKNSSVFLENDEIFIEYKNNMERLNDSVKYIPYLYSINNE